MGWESKEGPQPWSSSDQVLVLRFEKEFRGPTNSKQESVSVIKVNTLT